MLYPMLYLSDVFRFTFAYGQKGHQIGRKVGDALELIIMALIYRNEELLKYLVVENGVEGASGAKHKVEFAFYKLLNEKPSKEPEDLFGLIECKKVGAEVTVKQSFKVWKKDLDKSSLSFHDSSGFSFNLNKKEGGSININIAGMLDDDGNNIIINEDKKENKFRLDLTNTILIATDTDGILHIFTDMKHFYEIPLKVKKCIVIRAKDLHEGKIKSILVEECLTGPQTPEKAKQASFVSLDVRKRVLGTFDPQKGISSFISCLVIGEISHWEQKSRSIINLCNDFNLYVPDEVIINLFQLFEEHFGVGFQDMMTKNHYKSSEVVREILDKTISKYEEKVLKDLKSDKFVKPSFKLEGNEPRLFFEEVV